MDSVNMGFEKGGHVMMIGYEDNDGMVSFVMVFNISVEVFGDDEIEVGEVIFFFDDLMIFSFVFLDDFSLVF